MRGDQREWAIPLEAVGGNGIANRGKCECWRSQRKISWSVLVEDTVSEGVHLLQQLLPGSGNLSDDSWRPDSPLHPFGLHPIGCGPSQELLRRER